MTQWAINAYAFVFNDTATTEIYTLSLHDALPISSAGNAPVFAVEVWPYQTSLPICLYTPSDACPRMTEAVVRRLTPRIPRSEEHTSELQSRQYLVCRLLLEKKKNFYCYAFSSGRK